MHCVGIDFVALKVDFPPLGVNSGIDFRPLGMDVWPLGVNFRPLRVNFGPLIVNYRSLEFEFRTLVVHFRLLEVIFLGIWELIFSSESRFWPLRFYFGAGY